MMWENVIAQIWRLGGDNGMQAVYMVGGGYSELCIGWLEVYDGSAWHVCSEYVVWDRRDIDGLRARLTELLEGWTW